MRFSCFRTGGLPSFSPKGCRTPAPENIALYSKTLNNILYENLAVKLTCQTVGETIPGPEFGLMYIPTDAEVDRMPFAASTGYTIEQQKANFKTWPGNDAYLKKHRGEYFERYAANEKFEHHFDLHLSHRIALKIGREIRSLEFSLDIINIGNMLNPG